ncbi:hypothetical protein [Nocardia brasiliensis]|uniref:hypothetical protein n=1 Tax=Nocardia brasiliensis TaxID=37326 RepID=UPI0011DD1D4D|nr:hypothetical protein [Nocardia brasiliensis]
MTDPADPSASHDAVTAHAPVGRRIHPRSRWWRFSRPCYDKFWRCPGWNGGGPRFAKVVRCRDGRITYPGAEYGQRGVWWRLGRCSECSVLVWPLWITKLSPWVLAHDARYRLGLLDVRLIKCLDAHAAWVLDIADRIDRRR